MNFLTCLKGDIPRSSTQPEKEGEGEGKKKEMIEINTVYNSVLSFTSNGLILIHTIVV